MNKETVINNVVNMEWEFFIDTINIGTKAPCQQRKDIFFPSRQAYWNIYSEEILQCHFHDLIEHRKNKRNIIAQKYAYMMKSTDPTYFNSIRHLLPSIDEKTIKVIDSIMLIYMNWEHEVHNTNVQSSNNNRPLDAKKDTKTSTSVETYMRGEFCTYSFDLLTKILIYFLEQVKNHNNLALQNITELNWYEKLHSAQQDENTDTSTCSTIYPQNKKFDTLSLENAIKLSSYAEKIAKEINVPVTIAIVNASGDTVVLHRMDDCILASIDISLLKAKTAVYYNCDTKSLSEDISLRPLCRLKTKDIEGCFLAGGVPLHRNNRLIGGIGISGGSIEEDMQIVQKTVDNFFVSKIAEICPKL